MIKRLKYHEIDFQKYQNCLENSEQNIFYAQKEYLDFLCENWELAVYNDYEAVMPIPIKKKLSVSVVLMPLFLQQLGVFSQKDSTVLNDKFLGFLLKNYNIFSYAFNSENQFNTELEDRKNYVIHSQDYQVLRKSYFKGRKSTVKSAQNHFFKEISLDDFTLRFIEKHFKGLEKKTDQKKLLDFIKLLHQNQKLKLFASYLEKEITSLAITISEGNELFLLGLVSNAEFKENNGASFLIDAILKNNIKDKSFNFMGGNIRGIEVFFKSFGAELQTYKSIQNSKKQLIRTIFTKK